MSEDGENAAFDKIMELVGNDGKFQRVFNNFYNVALVSFASMSFMNIVMVLNEPDHTCRVPGHEKYNLSVNEWMDLMIPMETDNRGTLTKSGCNMYNSSRFEHLPISEWNFTKADEISCVNGYEYNKTWYERTTVSDQDWICEKALYQTNVFVWHRVGEVVGTFLFGQLGDTNLPAHIADCLGKSSALALNCIENFMNNMPCALLILTYDKCMPCIGRRPVFYISVIIIILGRIMTTLTASNYLLYAISSLISLLTSMSIFLSPLIIAMETSKEEDRGKIAMLQCVGWTIGISIMPLVFWAVRDWVWFLMLTTLPIGLFALYPKYMIESPRWLATKRHLARCANELNRIAKINGKKVEITEKMLVEMLPDEKVEEVFGIASLFTGWRLAKNTILIVICWTNVSIVYYVLILNSTRMGGNPFLSFLYQSAIELPAFIFGRWISDRIGRRFSNAIAFLSMAIACIPAAMAARNIEDDHILTMIVVFIKFCTSITFFAVNLQSMEIYPTCLRQSGIAVGSIIGNSLAVCGPYIVYVGTEYDVRYTYFILGGLCFMGFCAAMFLPETLHHQLPNTLHEAKKFGKTQKFWVIPKKPEPVHEEELESLAKLNNNQEKVKV